MECADSARLSGGENEALSRKQLTLKMVMLLALGVVEGGDQEGEYLTYYVCTMIAQALQF